MTQKEIRRRREVIDAKFVELKLQAKLLCDERRDLQKQCAHSNRSETHEFVWWKEGKVERCDDCDERFFYK